VQISTLPSVRHAVLLAGIDGTHVPIVDPAYGLHEITRKRFAEIWYGKTIKFRNDGARDAGYAGRQLPSYLRRKSG
ncbi:MAG: hypothetical protein QF886_23580, partial [Planctomycetota bacterium]|nr:hypothetical protein [Planctomycetota bacterium]